MTTIYTGYDAQDCPPEEASAERFGDEGEATPALRPDFGLCPIDSPRWDRGYSLWDRGQVCWE